MCRHPVRVEDSVNCRIGSLEIPAKTGNKAAVVNCRIGSLENFLELSALVIDC